VANFFKNKNEKVMKTLQNPKPKEASFFPSTHLHYSNSFPFTQERIKQLQK
jgi:hypothetical protein